MKERFWNTKTHRWNKRKAKDCMVVTVPRLLHDLNGDDYTDDYGRSFDVSMMEDTSGGQTPFGIYYEKVNDLYVVIKLELVPVYGCQLGYRWVGKEEVIFC